MRNRILRTFAVLAAAAAWAAISCEGPVEPPEGPIPWDYYSIKGLNERASIADVYMLSASEGWAVTYGGYVLRFDGAEWRVHTDLSEKYPGIDLSRLSFCSPDEGWALGHGSGSASDELYIFRFDGTTWTRITGIPAELGGYYRDCDVEVLAPDDVWIANYYGLYHYDGVSWEGHQTRGAHSLSFSSSSNGWAAGYGRAYRWDGSQWQTTYGGFDAGLDIGCPSGNSAWTVGGLPGGCEMPSHYEISLWDETKQEWVRYYGGLFKDPYFTLERVHFASPTDGWAVGSNIIIRYDGAKWREFAVPPSGANCVFTLGGDDVWVGGWGCLFKYAPFEKG
jgi:hypothetical protein